MIDLGKIWLERSQREQNLIMLTMISVCLALLILLSSSILSQTNQSRNQLKKAKQDFEYVKNGADRLIGFALASSLKDQPNEIRRIINEIASQNDLGEIEVSFDSDKMFSTFTIDDIDQIIVFINQVNGKIGLNIRSLDYVNSNKVGSVTVVFEMVN
ncbi:MAG: type II secretion system protein M [Gammaproteobacteria bacterium]|nr:type II secretion system protein M [Gammaproteobacteria bacterium]